VPGSTGLAGTHHEVDAIIEVMRRLRPASPNETVDIIAAATSLSGAFWQMANPPPK
jgi:hypothetical protein